MKGNKEYAREVYESAGMLALSEADGIENLAYYCVHFIRHDGDLAQGCKEYVSQDVLIYTQDRKEWLEKKGITTDDPDETFNEICGKAAHRLVQKYITDNKLRIVREGNTICNAKLEGIPATKGIVNIPEGETHRVLFAFREEICLGFINRFCEEFEPEEIQNDNYGLTFMVNLDKTGAEYIEMMGYDFAFSMICDLDQKSENPSSLRPNESETRVLPIIRCGNSLAINVTPICTLLGLDKGDMVKVKIEKLEG